MKVRDVFVWECDGDVGRLHVYIYIRKEESREKNKEKKGMQRIIVVCKLLNRAWLKRT